MSNNSHKPALICIVGATASGKTDLSMRIAHRLKGEIVCMDSMQIYRYMDIGTAKPTPAEQAQAPHHMLDIVLPTESFSVSQYVQMARKAIDSILSRNRTPVLVGGTGLYLRGLSMPQDYGGLPSDPAVRDELTRFLSLNGPLKLHDLLKSADPVSAARLHPNDTRRVIRAIEILRLTGIPMSEHRSDTPEESPYRFFIYAADRPRAELHSRINRRVDRMIADGLADEVKMLINMGVTPDMQSMQGIGYKELIPFIAGKESLEDASEKIKTGTRNYARRQLIWFRRDNRICWLDAADMEQAEKTIIKDWESQ